MCGRFYQLRARAAFLKYFGIDAPVEGPAEPGPRYNIAPGAPSLVIRAGEVAAREPAVLRWGLVPPWAKDEKIGYKLINARAETVHEKPSFRDSFRSRRCLVPVDGFYEWRREGKLRLPHRFARADGEPLALAGLWTRWTRGTAPLETFTMITTEANATMAPIHDRMPVILSPGDWDRWLAPRGVDEADLRALLVPAPPELLEVVAVSRFVNDARHEGAGCHASPE